MFISLCVCTDKLINIKIIIVTVSKESQDRSDFNSTERTQIELVIIKQSGGASILTNS